jgi:hypothetical protein
VENHQTEVNRNSDKKKELDWTRHYVKKQEPYRNPHYIEILRDIEEEVSRRERGEGQHRMK